MIDWNIQARSHLCQACHKHFVDQETFHTTLRDVRHGFERRDLCGECWKLENAPPGPQGGGAVVSQWQAVYTPPPAAPPEAIRKDTAESLLRKLIEQNDPAHEGARFVLAVMLERKRLLKSKGQVRENDRRVLIYEQPKSGDVFTIVDPGLHLNQLEAVQRDVLQLLEHGIGPEPVQEPAAAVESSPAPHESAIAPQP